MSDRKRVNISIDPATFCELLAFYEEAERHNDEVRKIASRLGMSD